MATSSLLSCVCWEWRRDDGGFSPYPPDISNTIEGASARGQTTVSLPSYTVDIGKLLQRSASSGHSRAIRRTTLQLYSRQSTAAYWTWEAQPSQFVPYETKTSIIIEAAHLSRLTSINLSGTAVALPYTIDFHRMEQTRHSYNTKRKIRRCPLTTGTVQYLLALPLTSLSVLSPTSHCTMVTRSITTPTSSFGNSTGAVMYTGTTAKSPKKSGARKNTKVSLTSTKAAVKSATATTKIPGTVNKIKKSGKAPSSKKARGSVVGVARRRSVLGLDDRFSDYVRVVDWVKHEKDEPCPICMNNLTEAPGFEDDTTPSISLPPLDVCKLRKCGHMLHRPCLLMYIKSTGTRSGFQCPTCKKSYGIRTGDMPSGTMNVSTRPFSLPGHEGFSTIEITYNFKAGVQNGRRYRVNGFPRTCYLPDSPKGQKVLALLRIAWERKLTFTIGTSVTTGATDTLVWNEIHHKTETNNYGGHGYPDPNYLDNVMLELAAQGVEGEGSECVEECGSEDEPFVISSDSDDEL